MAPKASHILSQYLFSLNYKVLYTPELKALFWTKQHILYYAQIINMCPLSISKCDRLLLVFSGILPFPNQDE